MTKKTKPDLGNELTQNDLCPNTVVTDFAASSCSFKYLATCYYS